MNTPGVGIQLKVHMKHKYLSMKHITIANFIWGLEELKGNLSLNDSIYRGDTIAVKPNIVCRQCESILLVSWPSDPGNI